MDSKVGSGLRVERSVPSFWRFRPSSRFRRAARTGGPWSWARGAAIITTIIHAIKKIWRSITNSRAVKQNIVIAAVTISWATWTSSTSTTGRLGWGLRAFEFAVFDHLEIQHCTMTKDVRWGATVYRFSMKKRVDIVDHNIFILTGFRGSSPRITRRLRRDATLRVCREWDTERKDERRRMRSLH